MCSSSPIIMANVVQESVDVTLTVKPAIANPTPGSKVAVDVFFSRLIDSSKTSTPPTAPQTGPPPVANPTQPAPTAVPPIQIQDSLRFTLDELYTGEAFLNDVVRSSSLTVHFLGFDGRALVIQKHTVPEPAAGAPEFNVRVEVKVTLQDADIKTLTASETLPEAVPGMISRSAAFVSLIPITPAIDYSSAQLQVAPLIFDQDHTWEGLGFQELLRGTRTPSTAATFVSNSIPPALLGLDWSVVRVAVDGRFTAVFPPLPKGAWSAWAWLLSGSTLKSPILGVVSERLETSIDRVRSIFLPPPTTVSPTNPRNPDGPINSDNPTDATTPSTSDDDGFMTPSTEESDCACHDGKRPPPVVSEAELAANPSIYTEDPGAFCKPFSNPARILSERSFFSVVRTEMPVISAEATINLREAAQIDFDPPDDMLEGIDGDTVESRAQLLSSGTFLRSNLIRDGNPFITNQAIVSGDVWRSKVNAGLSVFKDELPHALIDIFNALNRGRRDMDSAHPAQWDSESIRYQATTIARGHILEFQVRTRSNGYSLGGVAKTLTLAPRQTKRMPVFRILIFTPSICLFNSNACRFLLSI